MMCGKGSGWKQVWVCLLQGVASLILTISIWPLWPLTLTVPLANSRSARSVPGMWTLHLLCGLQRFVALNWCSLLHHPFPGWLGRLLDGSTVMMQLFLFFFSEHPKETVLTVSPHVRWHPCDLHSHGHKYPPFRVKGTQHNLAVFIGLPWWLRP